MAVNWNLGEIIANRAFDYVLAGITRDLANRIRELTPIGNPALWTSAPTPGYTPGTLRASWTHSYNKTAKEGTIYNPMPYAYRVEYGWSKQAPNGMVRIAIKEFEPILNGIAKANMI